MQFDTSRFGLIELQEKEIFMFEEGIPGFPGLKKFFWLPVKNNPVFRWLQSADDRQLAFLLADPFVFVPAYHVELLDGTLEKIRAVRREDIMVYTTVTIPPEGLAKATTNLLGPLIFNIKSRLACQTVLEGAKYGIKHLLFSKENMENAVNGGE